MVEVLVDHRVGLPRPQAPPFRGSSRGLDGQREQRPWVWGPSGLKGGLKADPGCRRPAGKLVEVLVPERVTAVPPAACPVHPREVEDPNPHPTQHV